MREHASERGQQDNLLAELIIVHSALDSMRAAHCAGWLQMHRLQWPHERACGAPPWLGLRPLQAGPVAAVQHVQHAQGALARFGGQFLIGVVCWVSSQGLDHLSSIGALQCCGVCLRRYQERDDLLHIHSSGQMC